MGINTAVIHFPVNAKNAKKRKNPNGKPIMAAIFI